MANNRDRHGVKENLLEMGGNNGVHRDTDVMRLERKKMETVMLNDDRSPSDHGEGLEEPLEDHSDDSESLAESHISHSPDPNTCKGKLAAFLKTNIVQYSVITLVIADCVIIVLELLIDMKIIVFPESPPQSHNVSLSHVDQHNVTHDLGHAHHHGAHGVTHDVTHSLWNSTLDGYNNTNNSTHEAHHPHHHTNKEKAEHVLHALSLAILSIFMVEVSLKIFVERTHLLKQPAEVFDAVVVIVSFTLDITFSFVSVTSAAQDAAGLMVLLRLWRVTRIINGVILSVKLDAKKKIDEVKRALRHAEHENKKLKSKVDKLENKLKRARAEAKANNEANSRELKSLKKDTSIDNQVIEMNSPSSFIFENNLHEIELRDLSDKT